MNEHDTQEQHDAALDREFDAQFGVSLTRCLREELEPHVGSATAKLDALLAAPVIERRPSFLRIGLRYSAAAMLLLGLGVSLPVISSQFNHSTVVTPPIAIEHSSKPPADAIVTSWSETVDAGTVFVDPETPARMLKRVQYEKAEWKDAAGKWQSAVTSPNEDVILVDLQKQ